MSTTAAVGRTAAEILTAAGVAENFAFYGPFTGKAVLTVPQLIMAAWAANDADRFADIFTENGSLLMQDTQLTSREEIRQFMADGFRGAYRGAHVDGWPLHLKFLRPDVAMVVTQGGIILDGQAEVAPERAIRAVWVIVADGDRWRLLSHQSSPIRGPGPHPTAEGEGSMSSKASSLVAQAKQWATYYGGFTKGEEGAVLSVPLRARATWDRNDADAFAQIFIENGSMLVGDTQLKGREEIRSYIAEAFAGPYRGSRLVEEPDLIQRVSDDVAVAVTHGGVIPPGATELPPDRVARATYVTVKRDGEWQLVSYQSSPIKG
jgi:uncharacterized protein (TIGR02246 family)